MVDDFYIQELCGVQDKATELGYEVRHPESPRTWDPTLQIPILNAAIAAQTDAIIVVPTEPKALVPPLKQAKADGIQVVTVDQPLADDSIRASSSPPTTSTEAQRPRTSSPSRSASRGRS